MTLEELRADIDVVDSKLRDLFIERMEIAHKIAEIKASTGENAYQPDREAAMIERNSAKVDEKYRELYIEFLKKNIELSRNYQKQFLGDESDK